jgi:hypothetical protein
MTALAAAKNNKLSRRKRAKAKQTLNKAFLTVVSGIETDTFLRNHLFTQKAAKNKIAVGLYIIVKNDEHMFDIYKKNMNNLVHKDIMLFDAAMAIVESYNMKNSTSVKKVIEVEEEYARNYMEMRHFENAYKNAVENNDDNACVFEDRYTIAKYRAKQARELLRGFRTAGK